MSQNRTEWVMHVWGKKRDTLELNDVEKFHIDMLRMFQPQQKRFDKIIINIALDDENDMDLFNFLREEISKVLVNDNVEFSYCRNESKLCEYTTFRQYVFDRIGEDVNVLYTHFKGYRTFLTVSRESFPMRVTDLSEMFWSYIMYMYSMDIDDVQKNLKKNSTYSWFVLKGKDDEANLKYYNEYHDIIQNGDARFKDYVEDDLHKHSPGSFVWYNLKNIGKSLKDKPLIKNITTDFLIENSIENKVNLCTHFCEVYLMNFLKEDECYSVKDYNEEMHNLTGTLYTQIYPSKKFGKEFIKDFEKYLIEKELI